MFIDRRARVARTEEWGDYHCLSLESPEIASQARPGQFLMVKINDTPHPLLRRPLSIHARNGNTVEVFFKVSGTGTSLLANKREQETLDLLGPLGKGFRLEEGLEGKAVWAVGGGRGIAPLYFLAQEILGWKAGFKVLYGGKTRTDLPLLPKFTSLGAETICSTDNGSLGFPGLVSDLLRMELRKTKPDLICACGPEAMMEVISRIAFTEKIPAQFSLETLMGCGFGACWGCVKRLRLGGSEEWVKVCEEGPVFAGEEIVWPEEKK